MRLREWQHRFQECVLQPEEVDQVLMAHLSPGSIDKQAQIGIYRNAYAIRLVEALRSNYPALHQLLGDDDFDAMGRRYLKNCPPTEASIRWFGHSLSEYLEQQAPYDALPVLSELARFEWALRHTIDAADREVVSVETLQAVSPERWGALRFALHPSASVLNLQWNTPQVWQALSDGLPPPDPCRQPMTWLIHRRPDRVGAWRSVSDPEQEALACLARGGHFSDICEVVASSLSDDEDSALQSAQLLRLWVEQGLISFFGD